MRRPRNDGHLFMDGEVLRDEGLAPSRKRRRMIAPNTITSHVAMPSSMNGMNRAFQSFDLAGNQSHNNIQFPSATSLGKRKLDGAAASASTTDDYMLDAGSDHDDWERPLTPNEITEREIVRALAFGRRPFQRVESGVERKIEDLIRGSIRDAQKQESESSQSQSQCDDTMDIESKPSPSMGVVLGGPGSNSLPRQELPADEEADMDTS